MKCFKICIAVFIILFLFGCGEPTFDASSKESFQKSFQSISKTLTTAEENNLMKEMMDLMGIITLENVFNQGGLDDVQLENKYFSMLNGKTYPEVIQFIKEYKGSSK